MSKSAVVPQKRVVALIPQVFGSVGPLYAFFADRGVRETIESIVVAVLLALLFRGFEGEAFMIPTGSMAPGLRGHHVDQWCDKCGVEYQTGATFENNLTPVDKKVRVIRTYCPICGTSTILTPVQERDHVANQGDRILVNKYVYDFAEPDRFDVIVFKNPNNGKQNLIKRLVGLPGENIVISRGDVYVVDEKGGNRKIVRKPADKQLAMLQLVDDTSYRAKEMVDAGWPEKWNALGTSDWDIDRQSNKTEFQSDGGSSDSIAWLRFKNILPRWPVVADKLNDGRIVHRRDGDDWEASISNLKVPADIQNSVGALIGDYCCYNDYTLERDILEDEFRNRTKESPSPANHWVGDLAVEATFVAESGTGKIVLMLVEGGASFFCTIDPASGAASFSCDAPDVQFVAAGGGPVAAPSNVSTGVRMGVSSTVTFCNSDNQLILWVNGKHIEIPGATFNRPETFYPQFNSSTDPLDAQPVGLGVSGLKVSVSRLRVLRDVYYTSQRGENRDIRNETRGGNSRSFVHDEILAIHDDPSSWNSSLGKELFDASVRSGPPMFMIPQGCYFPMGDNSPESKDARIWEGPNYFSRELLIGRAMLVYWPHARNRPIPVITPNFSQMRPIQ